LAAAQVGNTTQWATDTKASGERVDQAVDTLGRGEVLAGDTQQQSFLSRLCGAFERTAHTETYRATLEQFTSLLGASSPRRQRSAAQATTEQARGQQELRQCVQRGVGD
jgi:hypothetical protein